MTPAEQITAAAEAMEQQQWPDAISLLIGVLAERQSPDVEATVRLLLAQSLHGAAQPVRALEQARQALTVAEPTNDRGLIWKCMALIASMEIIEDGRL